MHILCESDVAGGIAKLEEAWAGKHTFVFLPDKSGISREWVEEKLEKMPTDLIKDHFILLTSGSTGQPKLVVGLKRRAEKLAAVLHEVQDSEPAKQAIVALPLAYCYAFVNEWLWARVMKRQLVLAGGFNRPDVLKEALLKADKGLLCLVGAQIPLFETYFGREVSFPGIIRVHFAGSPFPQNKIDLIKQYFPKAKIFNNYGCAEAMPRLTIRTLEEGKDAANIGKPLPGVKLKTGKEDEIMFRSTYQAVAIYDDKGLHILTKDEWIPTGDLGKRGKGGYWQIKGRKSDVFKRYGEKISISRLLDTVYSSWNGQAEFYLENSPSGETAHTLVISPVASDEQVKNILRAFRKSHPRTHWPVRLESIESLPLLPNGKIDRMSLARMEDKKIHWKQGV